MITAFLLSDTGSYFGPIIRPLAVAFAVPTAIIVARHLRAAAADRVGSSDETDEPVGREFHRTRDEAESLLISAREYAERRVRTLARRQRIVGDDVDDVLGWIWERLTDNEYATIRKYKGTASFHGFLAITLRHLVLDWMNKEWGKWRPPVATRRLGKDAIALARLIHRDGLTAVEAVEKLLSSGQATHSRAELTAMAAKLPPNTLREHVVLHDELQATGTPDPGETLLRKQNAARRDRAVAALHEALRQLDPEDALIVKMRYFERIKIVTIAKSLGHDQFRLYRRVARILLALRATLEERNISCDDVRELFEEE